MALIEQINELQKKAGSYDLLKEEYDKLRKKLIEINNLSQSDDFIPKKACKDNILYDEYECLKTIDGYEVSVSSLYDKYGMESQKANNTTQRLKSMPNIDFRKEDNRLILFYRKGKKEADKDLIKSLKGSKISVLK